MSKWSDFYGTRAHNYVGYKEYCKIRYAPFLRKILNVCENGQESEISDDILPMSCCELGCGMATISRILADVCSRDCARFMATDIDEDMLAIASMHAHSPHGRGSLFVSKHDALRPTLFRQDVVYSHGLLEHFSNVDIRTIISAHKQAYQVHYVPGMYDSPSFGDERLMAVDDWRAICDPDEVHTFNEGLDYTLIFHPK